MADESITPPAAGSSTESNTPPAPIPFVPESVGPKLFDVAGNDLLAGWHIKAAPEQEDTDIREALRKAVERRKQHPDPDYIKKQMEGVLPPKPIISPEHYHISYEYDGRTYPHVQVGFRKAREAYLEIWRVHSLAVQYGEPEFDEVRGSITISTPLKGRTGIYRITLVPVECFLLECARNPSPLQPLLERGYGDIRR